MFGSSLSDEEKENMINFLRAYIDMFVWQQYDMYGINAEVMCYRLHIDKKFKTIKQKPRRAAPEKARAVEEEVQNC